MGRKFKRRIRHFLLFVMLLILLGMFCYLMAKSIMPILSQNPTGRTIDNNNNEPTPNKASLETNSIEVLFCPREDCEGRLESLLASANESIECAAFEMDLDTAIAMLEHKSKTIPVRLVVDDSYFYEVENTSFAKKDGKQGLMHNKFCIIDSRIIYTGSFNPTDNCAHKNNNNMLVIESSVLARNYQAEFEELWSGTFAKGGITPTPEVLLIDLSDGREIQVENHFCPEDDCRQQVLDEIAEANSSIRFMLFSFTDDRIGRALVMAHNKGISVEGVFEKKQLSEYSEQQLLAYQGIKVMNDTNKYNMHHKVFIIDNRTVITGSFNPSANANERNDENILIVKDEWLAKKYIEEYELIKYS